MHAEFPEVLFHIHSGDADTELERLDKGLVERGLGYAFCIDQLVNTEGRDLVFRPITPELSTNLYLATKKYQVFSPAVNKFMEMLKSNLGEK